MHLKHRAPSTEHRAPSTEHRASFYVRASRRLCWSLLLARLLVKNYIDQWHTGVYMYRNALWSCTSTGTLKWWKNQTIGDAYWPNGHDASVLVTPPRLKLCS